MNGRARTNSGPSRLVLPVLAILSLLLLAPATGIAREPGFNGNFDRGLAIDLVAEARRLIARDAREEAEFLLQRAHVVDTTFGDPLYLLASLLPHQPDTVQVREQMLRRAYATDLDSVSPDEIAADLARILIDTARPGYAIDILDQRIRERDGEEPIYPAMGERSPSRLDVLLLEAFLMDQPGWFSSSLLTVMRNRYPEDETLAFLDWRRMETISPAHLEWLGPFIAGSEGAGLPVIAHTLRLVPSELDSLRLQLTELYYERGGDDPVPAVIALAAHGRQVGGDVLRDALDRSDKRIWQYAATVTPRRDWPGGLPEPMRSSFTEVKNGRHVEMVFQIPGKFATERVVVREGGMTRWSRDSAGDGVNDLVVDRPDSRELSVLERHGDRIVRIDYAPYPLVTRAWSIPLVSDEPHQRWTAMMRESLKAGGVRRWLPPEPVSFDPGLSVMAFETTISLNDLELRDILAGSVFLPESLHGRFQRQFDSSGARMLTRVEETELEGYLRTLGLMR